ncbi:Na+/H+ antiporter subunit E [Aliidiomarina taiwanensis]|uniref:Na+/H+ antiporter subunit E n=1 Tax=Aliidiomarina taiwanensis TaxID=946228 RepID=A0A432X8J0_9GAMM|nr:Na+/H+ antiporter subunit E [Aliidiomarina taiwanensis]RUO43646.1 Na+/H+ antiporter subunit E [Aliidiomarina taiwanensis]
MSEQREHVTLEQDAILTKKKWLPHPFLSVNMLLIWLALNNASMGHFVLGSFLAIGIPYLVQAFWPQAVRIYRPMLLVQYLFLVLVDICKANVIVAIQILGPSKKLKAKFFEVPLDVKDDFTITMLAGTITLTPGTVSAELSPDKKRLLVHGLNVESAEEEIELIKQRYEKPLKEIFECSTRSS